MAAILTYVFQVNLLLSLLFLGYHFLLRGLTFYELNRVYLVLGAVYAFVYPFLDINSWFAKTIPLVEGEVLAYFPVIPPASPEFGLHHYLVWLMGAGGAIFFDIPVDHLDGAIIFVPYIKSLNLESLVIASPDMGGSYRARTFAKFFNAEVVICDKQRKRANEIESMSIIGDVTGQDVVLIDDICDTAGTLSKAAALIMEKGARSVRAVCTHAVLSGKAYETIENSVLSELIVTDTIQLNPEKTQQCSKIKTLSTADLFAGAIKNVNEHGSISGLFVV